MGNANTVITGISIDSRNIASGNFFVPIKGENFDGNQFVTKALEAGAVGSFIESGKFENSDSIKNKALVEVHNAKLAMGELAKYYRKKFSLPVIAITGSNGKTSTKEMTASILSTQFNVLKSEGSFNNDIGLPLTLFKLNQKHQVVVLEMGMNHYGEIRQMVSLIPPDIGVVTNVAEAHLEFFGSLDNIAKAKFELLESMTEKNTAVLNADDSRVAGFSKKIKAKSVFFGIKNGKTEFFAKDIRFISDPYGLEFVLKTPSREDTVYLPTLGDHQVGNAIAAAAAAWQMNPHFDSIREGLKNFKPAKMRMQIIPIGKSTIINDAYNANPISMKAALETLSKLPCKGKKMAVLSDMLELGDYQKQAHEEVGTLVSSINLDYLITIGNLALSIGESARRNGMPESKISFCSTKKEAVESLTKLMNQGDLVLIKGSRKMKMEELVENLKNRFKN